MKSMLPMAAAVAVTALPLTAAEVTGKVTLKGTPPPATAIAAVKADANCGKVSDGNAKTRTYVVGEGGALANTVVYIKKGLEGKTFPAPSTKPEIDQKGCMYYPYVTAVMVNQKFDVKNSDPFMHNVNATPKVNKGFNFAQASKGQINDKVFDKAELGVRFACNVHPWMVAYVHVLENPFFAVTDEAGAFELPEGLPPGKYELEVNHLKSGTVKQEIEVAAGKGASVVFELAPAAK